MIPDRIIVWTSRGYQSIENVAVGDRVISYNPKRNCSEYDTVGSIETTWGQCGLIGVKKAGMHSLMTPDHELIVLDVKTKEITRTPINDLFMRRLGANRKLITKPMFEPYARTAELEDIEWSARMAASSSRSYTPSIWHSEIWNIIRDISGYEAQIWLSTFFGWNIMRNRWGYMKTIIMRNQHVKDMVYHVGPRAGVATYWGTYKTGPKAIPTHAMSISTEGDLAMDAMKDWRADRQEGILFNISTNNGSFLARYLGSTYIMTCKYKEK